MRKTPPVPKPKSRKQSLPFKWRVRVIAHSPSFRWLAHRDSRAIACSRFEAEDQAWVDAMSWWNSDEAIVDVKARDGTLASIKDLIGSVDSLPADLSAKKKQYLSRPD